jgi:hypothetical protein
VRVVGLSALGAFYAVACGKSQNRDDDDDCRTGSERCDCHPDGTCDGSLECRSGLCVEPDDSGGGGRQTGGANQGGKGGTQITGIPSGGAFPTGGAPATGGVFPVGGTGGTDDGGGVGGDTGDAGEPSTGGVAGVAGGIGGVAGVAGGVGGRGGAGRGNGGQGGMLGGSGGATGGAGASGASGACGTAVAGATDTLIDNLEDNNGQIAPPRVGYWYVYTDMTCTTTPPPDATGANLFRPTAEAGQSGSYGARLTGGACSTWGAGLGFDLNNCNARQNAYNASVFHGISFWYKSTVPFRANVTTLDVIPTSQGGTCTDVADQCYNPHGVDVPASPAGMAVSVAFSSLTQAFGTMNAFDVTRIVNLQFQVGIQTGTWEIAIDNVAFLQ